MKTLIQYLLNNNYISPTTPANIFFVLFLTGSIIFGGYILHSLTFLSLLWSITLVSCSTSLMGVVVIVGTIIMNKIDDLMNRAFSDEVETSCAGC